MYIGMREIIGNVLSLRSLYHPKVVFVTGPHAMFHAYRTFLAPNCCNGTVTNKAVTKNDAEMTGMLEKIVWKSSRGNEFISSKYGFEEIVPYNETLNVTRSKRIEMDSGITHWGIVNYRSKEKLAKLGLSRHCSCREYIRRIKDGSLKQIDQF